MPYISAALFLAFFMLTDPPTSPGKYKEQMIFVFFLAGAASVSAFFFLSKLSYLLVGLLFANVWKAWAARSHNVTASRPKKKMAES
ncbi:hypothetical protein QS257_10230 [Terrilactibacillus sp. S3-3]|nr:hypothetical protein QS257_10230 [Terrilactibacillus sp. S3-3]